MWFLASGGSAQERATPTTPASNWASIIDLQAGPKAQWISVGAQQGLGNRWWALVIDGAYYWGWGCDV